MAVCMIFNDVHKHTSEQNNSPVHSIEETVELIIESRRSRGGRRRRHRRRGCRRRGRRLQTQGKAGFSEEKGTTLDK